MNKVVLLAHFLGVTWSKYRQLLSVFSSLEEAWEADHSTFKQTGWRSKAIHEFFEWKNTVNEKTLQSALDHYDIRAVSIDDPTYPPLLKQVYDPPLCLFVRGELPSGPMVAVVGSRKCTTYGRMVAEQLVGQLAQSGVVIVSGLAFGIDSIAHKTTLETHGQTIAVLGSGIDDDTLHPHAHQGLAHEIISSGGAIISEYPPFTQPSKFTFPLRNRIIAGLSSATLVIEAGEHSGALITASYALDNNREVFAVPHHITSHTGRGTNLLLKSGAHIALSAEDIYEVLDIKTSPTTTAAQQSNLSEQEKQLLKILRDEPSTVDELVLESGIESREIGSILSYMEIRGLIANRSGIIHCAH